MISFGSDNHSGFHPHLLDWLQKANQGHAVAYGNDAFTAQAQEVFKSHFGPQSQTLLLLTGTGANVVALGSLCRSFEGVICAQTSHIHVDECGSPEKLAGVKLLAIEGKNGKILPEDLLPFHHFQGVEHHVQPRILSLTQPTEVGTVYTVEELRALCGLAHQMGLLVHMDGSRLANALAATRQTALAMTRDAGIDVLSLGGTKNGLIAAESVVFLQSCLADAAIFVRKQSAQLVSKMRFVAAQFLCWFEDDLWLKNAAHANAMATLLKDKLVGIQGVDIEYAVEVNAVFARISPQATKRLHEAGWFFHVWDPATNLVRWMTSFDSTPEDIQEFAMAIREAVEE